MKLLDQVEWLTPDDGIIDAPTEFSCDKYKVWSLLDLMERFRASAFGQVTSNLGNAQAFLAFDAPDEEVRENLITSISLCASTVEALPLSLVVKRQFQRLLAEAKQDELDRSRCQALVREFHQNLLTEMREHLYLVVRSDRRLLFEQGVPLFGTDVETMFGDTQYDIAAAGRCLALDEWTACVFHLMRVLEKALHQLARELEVPMADTIEFQQWHVVIDQITSTIDNLKKLPKSPEKSKTLQIYSEAAQQFRFFKEAWRDHVMHSRSRYDERQAIEIWTAVRSFMEHLARAKS